MSCTYNGPLRIDDINGDHRHERLIKACIKELLNKYCLSNGIVMEDYTLAIDVLSCGTLLPPSEVGVLMDTIKYMEERKCGESEIKETIIARLNSRPDFEELIKDILRSRKKQ